MSFLASRSLRYYCVATNISKQSSTTLPANQQNSPTFQTYVGLDVHCKLNVNSKLFSRSSNNFYAKANQCVSWFDAALPGTLPAVNRRCLELAIKSALALNCQINPICVFDREHIFEPSYPSGFRLVQSREPIASNGLLNVPIKVDKTCYIKTIELKSIHLEEDSGHVFVSHLDQCNCIDLNSRGLPLIKFSFKSTIMTALESSRSVNQLIQILERIGAFTPKIEERALSIDVKIKLVSENTSDYAVTIKGINSCSSLGTYIANEFGRQKYLIKTNNPMSADQTYQALTSGGMKKIKTEDIDPRSIINLSIPPFRFDSTVQNSDENVSLSIEKIAAELPSLPDSERSHLVDHCNLNLLQATKLIENDYAQVVIKMVSNDPSICSNHLYNFTMEVLNAAIVKTNSEINQLYNFIDNLVECFNLLKSKTISRQNATEMIVSCLQGDKRSPDELIIANEWSIIEDDKIITDFCKDVIKVHCTYAFFVKRGDKKFLKNLIKRVKIASNHRIPEEKIMQKLDSLISNIDKAALAIFTTNRNKKSKNRPNLFLDENQ
uniref:Glutamyl-tRNA(Gln) amidotransferase subunit B, mitochondrial n=2 Tax=Tetranychus urticae TaxID=32264 RepID=T1KMG7_TETUR